MTWTYLSPPTGRDIDKVRLLMGDTDSTRPLLTDEEIEYLLSLTGSVDPTTLRYTEAQIRQAAARAADSAAASLWSLADKSIGPTRIALSQRREALIKTADRLWGEVGGRIDTAAAVAPLLGGVSRGDDSGLITSDSKAPTFYKHMQEASPEPGVDQGGAGGSNPLLGGGGG